MEAILGPMGVGVGAHVDINVDMGDTKRGIKDGIIICFCFFLLNEY